MKLNFTIASWLNGEDFSIKRLRGENYNQLMKKISDDVCAKKIRSVKEAYTSFYQSEPVIYTKKVSIDRKLIYKNQKSRFLKPLFELQDYVNKSFSSNELFGFLVHGSLATNDFVENYSDFDTICIVRKEVIENPKWLLDFKKRLTKSNTFLYLLDPLQHHRHFVITEYDLLAYCEAIFPLELFKYSKELFALSAPCLEFKVIDSKRYLIDSLQDRLNSFKKIWPAMAKKGEFNSYEAKNAVQNILLLPALYLEMRDNRFYYKKDTFELAKRDFTARHWSLIERASETRQKCKFKSFYPYWFRKFLGLAAGPYFLKKLHNYFDKSIASCISGIMGEKFLDEAAEFTEQIMLNLNIQLKG